MRAGCCSGPAFRARSRSRRHRGAILRGKDAGEIPYYQAAKFELSINLKTATALGIAVPPTMLAVADNVIE